MPQTPPRIFAIGDIHGRADALETLLARIAPEPGRDSLIFLGDYINRGPDVRGVLDRLAALYHEMPGTVFLEGNHERALLDYAATGDAGLLRQLRHMGVEATLASYGGRTASALMGLDFMPPEHREFLENLRPYHRVPGYLFVHGGVPQDRAVEDCDPSALQTMHMGFLKAEAQDGETVIFGHTSLATPIVAPGRIGLDTGLHKGGMLTALELPAMVFHHATSTAATTSTAAPIAD